MLPVLGAIVFLWCGPLKSSAGAAPAAEEPAAQKAITLSAGAAAALPGSEQQYALAQEAAATPSPSPSPSPTPEPQPTPPGSGVYAASARPDGNHLRFQLPATTASSSRHFTIRAPVRSQRRKRVAHERARVFVPQLRGGGTEPDDNRAVRATPAREHHRTAAGVYVAGL